MAHRRLLLGLVVVIAACGGRFSSESPADGTGGSAGDGTGGSVGTGGTVTGGWTGAGGAAGGQGGSDWGACQPTDACVLEPVAACGPGCEPVPLSAFVGVNQRSLQTYFQSHPQAKCMNPMCPTPMPGQANVPNYLAMCVAGRCQPIDIRTSELSQCKVDTDCYVRGGTSCCLTCGEAVAFSHLGFVENAVCASGPVACPAIACAPSPYVPRAYCDPSGHCALQYASPTVDAGIVYPL
jgi:hypothetical protein